MTIEEIRRRCKFLKECGHTSQVNLPISVVMGLADEAEQFRRLPKIVKEASREMAETDQ